MPDSTPASAANMLSRLDLPAANSPAELASMVADDDERRQFQIGRAHV